MARDKTLQERIESILHAEGLKNSGAVAKAIMQEMGTVTLIAIEYRDFLRRRGSNPPSLEYRDPFTHKTVDNAVGGRVRLLNHLVEDMSE